MGHVVTVEAVRGIYGNWAKGDFSTVGALFAHDVILEPQPEQSMIRGLERSMETPPWQPWGSRSSAILRVMSQGNVAITRNLLEAFNRGDWDGAVEEATPDFECDFSRSNGSMRGIHDLDGWRRFLEEWGDSWEQLRIEAHEFIDVGEHVVVPWTMHATGRGGIEVVARTCWVFKLRDGRVAATTYYETKSEALEAVGASE